MSCAYCESVTACGEADRCLRDVHRKPEPHLKMAAPVTILPVVTCLDIAVQRVLDGAAEALLDHVVVVGTTQAGDFYFASNKSSGPECLWLLEQAKLKLLNV